MSNEHATSHACHAFFGSHANLGMVRQSATSGLATLGKVKAGHKVSLEVYGNE